MKGVRTIVHVDMDAFFVSCELLRRPELRGKPVVVGGTGARGVVATASYEARSFGVHSAMATARARRLCPQAVFLDGDHDEYRRISSEVMTTLGEITPLVEPLSLDEAFLDVSGSQRLFGDGETIAKLLRRRVLERHGLTCSLGVSAVKYLAKLATNQAKPRPARTGPVFGSGVHVIEPGTELEFLHPRAASELWGIGPATLAKLERYGIKTVGDLAQLPLDTLRSAVGSSAGQHLYNMARAIDDREVDPHREVKSISHEQTFAEDKFNHDELARDLLAMADSVGSRLRKSDLKARTVTIKVRFASFQTITRSFTPASPVSSGLEIASHARHLLDSVDVGTGVRLLGVAGVNLCAEQTQLSLLDQPETERAGWAAATDAIDLARERFGSDVLMPAAMIKRGDHAL